MLVPLCQSNRVKTMGKDAAFVCVIVLCIILFASGHRGDEGKSRSDQDPLVTSVQNGNTSDDEAKQSADSDSKGTTINEPPKGKSAPLREGGNHDIPPPACASLPDIPGTITPEGKDVGYPAGTKVTYNCALGYVSRNSLNHISECKIDTATGTAEWTIPEIKCYPRSCGDPGYVHNARRIGNLFTFPNKVEYECEDGYKLRGLKSRYCQAGGDWSGRLPTCELIYCSAPVHPDNGRVVYSSLEYGTELKYECNAGFVLKNHQVRMCSEDGKWSNEEPECIETTCNEPQPPIHGTVKLHGDLKVGSLATYSCNPGRRLHGSTTTKCLESGEWTFEAPECLRSCQVPFIEKGEMGRFETKYSTWGNRQEFKKILAGENVDSLQTLIFRCKKNAFPVDNSQLLTTNRLEVTCNDGIWSKELQCRQTHCTGEPPPSKNARPIIGSREHGYSIYYICSNRNAIKITGNVKCHLGSWIGTPPKCLDQPCYTKDLNYPGLVKPAEEHFNSFESFDIVCEEGYRKQTRAQKITCKRSQWDVTQNPCIFGREEDIIPTTRTNVESSSPQTTDVNPTQECFCTHEFPDSVHVQLGKNILRRSDSIKLGDTVSITCNSDEKLLKWQNGFRFFGKANMTCNTCTKWQKEDLPICAREVGYTYITYDGYLKILPGGIVHIPKGETRRYVCMYSSYRPVWEHGNRENVKVKGNNYSQGGKLLGYMSSLDIEQADNTHNGEYECFIRGEDGSHLRSTLFYLRVQDAEDKTTSSTGHPTSERTETSIQPTSESKKDCFCTYEFHDPLVKAQIGERTLEIGDTIRLHERVSFECPYILTALTWQNGLRLQGKVHMICNTCKKWQYQDVPICKSFEKSDTIISFYEDLNVLPGGIANVQKGKEHQFSCSSTQIYPEWDYGQRKGVSVTNTPVSGRGTSYYVTYLDFNKEVDEFNGTYECYIRDYTGRSGSTFLYLQFNDTDTCCPLIDGSGIFTLHYSNQRRINSTVTFFCKGSRMRIEGRSTLTCLPNRKWSGVYPKCVDYNSCPEFLNSPELKITYSSGLSVGSMAVFECLLPNKGLSGSQSSMCQTNLSWSSPSPICEDYISCPEFHNSSEMRVTYSDGLSVRSMAVFECLLPNKYLSGSHSSICLKNGSWSNPSPICEDYISCPEFPNSSEMRVTYSDGLSVRSMAVFECLLPNKYLSGSHSSICLKNRSWSNPSPICEDSTCSIHDLSMSVPETVEPDMSMVSGENVTFGSEVKLKCTKNFVMIGYSKAQCEEKGKWKLGRFQCVPGCSLYLDSSSHLSVEPKKDSYRTGDSITLSCPPGEETSNSVDSMMCMFGRWSDTLPECVQKGKEKPPLTSGITNTNFTHGVQGCPLSLDPASHLIVEPKKDVYRTGDSITLACPPGEETSNNVERMMCMLGRWSETFPECVQKVEERPRSTWRI